MVSDGVSYRFSLFFLILNGSLMFFSCFAMAHRWPQALAEPDVSALPLEQALDALTYVRVEFCHPSDGRCVSVAALVDTGSNDCDLKIASIEELKLPRFRSGGTSVETAANKVATGRRSLIFGSI